MKNRSFALLALGLGILVAVLAARTAAEAAPGDPKIIKIVSSLPRTGSSNKQTTDIARGVKMALEDVNYRVGEFELKYEDWDDASPQTGKWDATVEQNNATRVVNDPDVMVYIGTLNSGAAKISIPILNQADILMVSPANTWPGLTKPGTGAPNEPQVYRPTGKINFCRVVPADDIQGPMGVEWAKKKGYKRIFLMHDRELYGKGIADLFKKHAEKLGLEIVGFEGIDTQASNYNSLAAKVRGQNPDLVYFGGTTDSNGGQLAKDLRRAGLTCPLLAPDGCFEDAFIKAAGPDNVNGNAYATFGGAPADQWEGQGKEFLKRYKAKYENTLPEPYTIYGYECGKVAVEAIRRAGKKDRDAIRVAGISLKDFDGALGKWSFDANGDTTLSMMSINMVKDGQWVFLEYIH